MNLYKIFDSYYKLVIFAATNVKKKFKYLDIIFNS